MSDLSSREGKRVHHLYGLLGLLVTYALAYWIDHGAEAILLYANRSKIPLPLYFGFWSVANLVLGVYIFSIYTWIFPNLSKLAICIVLITGVAIAFLPTLNYIPYFDRFISLDWLISHRLLVPYTGGLVAAAATMSLLQPRPKNTQTK